MISRIRLALVLTPFLIVTLVAAPVQFIAGKAGSRLAVKIPLWWHRTLLSLLGVNVRIHGERSTAQPLLLAVNHVSWVDIVVLGSVCELCFIAKSEVRSWPGIKYLAILQRTVFVDRTRRRQTAVQAGSIASRMIGGDVMVLFAEGTTGNGNYIADFKSSLFGAAQIAVEQAGLETASVQPVAIAYTRLHGIPLGRLHQPRAAWPGDVRLAPHLSQFLVRGAFDVDVSFGEPIAITSTSDRKQIANRANAQVRDMFSKAMRGRGLDEVAAIEA